MSIINSASAKKYVYRGLVCILLFVFLTSVSIGTPEFALRKINYHYYPLQINVLGTFKANSLVPHNDNIQDWRYYHIFENTSFVYDPVLIWKPNPEVMIDFNGSKIHFFNKLGYPGKLFKPDDSEGKIRIVTLGDSNTLGVEEYDNTTNREVSWPGYLEYSLGNKYQVINAAAWGYSSYQLYQKFLQILKFKPNVIVFSDSMNDASLVVVPDKDYNFFSVAQTDLLLQSRLVQFIQSKFDQLSNLRLTNKNLIPRVSKKDYETYLRTMISESKKNNIKFIVVNRPFRYPYGYNDPDYGNRIIEYNDLTEKIAIDTQTPFIDMYKIYATQSALFIDDGHLGREGLTDFGNRVATEIAALQL